jgi:hypothetical protein
MSKQKLTPWFPASVKPARDGVYEVRGTSFDERNFRRWNGSGWGSTFGAPSVICQQDESVLYRHGEDMTGWRGLAEQPK